MMYFSLAQSLCIFHGIVLFMNSVLSLRLPVGGPWAPFGRRGAHADFLKMKVIVDERGCNSAATPMIIDGRG